MSVGLISAERKRGAYFTPQAIASILSAWAVRSPTDRVLDPSAGDGELIVSAVQRLRALGARPGSERVEGVEIDQGSAARAKDRLSSLGASGTIYIVSAFPSNGLLKPGYDGMVVNPPWVRYQLFSGEIRRHALEEARAHGVELSGRTSFWAPYLVYAASLLAPNGRLAAVVPAEIIAADYAQPIRDYLLRRFGRIRLLAFDAPCFSEVEVQPLVLLSDNEGSDGLEMWRLAKPEDVDLESQRATPIGACTPLLGARWTGLFAGTGASLWDTLCQHSDIVRLGSIAAIGLGIVTGSDRFFMLSRETISSWELPEICLVPALTTLKHASGLRITSADWQSMGASGKPVYMFRGPLQGEELTANAAAYVKHGETSGYNLSYKCRIRDPWYSLRLPAPSQALLTYMVGTLPRIVLNEAQLLSTNLAHRVDFIQGSFSPRAVAASATSTLTQISAELEGRSYGGGVLKLEVGDARRLQVVLPSQAATASLERNFEQIDRLLKNSDVEAAASLVDRIVLSDQLGLTHAQLNELRVMLARLRARRLHS